MSVRKEWTVHLWGVVAERRRMYNTEKAVPFIINAVRLVESDAPNNSKGVVTAVDLDLVSLEHPCMGAVVTVPMVKLPGSDIESMDGLLIKVGAERPWIHEPVRLLNGCIIRAKLYEDEIVELRAPTKKDFERAIDLGFNRNLHQAFPGE